MYISANYGDDQQIGLLSHDKSANSDTWTAVSFDFKTLLLWTGAAPEMLTTQSFLDLPYKYIYCRQKPLLVQLSERYQLADYFVTGAGLHCLKKYTQTKNTHKQKQEAANVGSPGPCHLWKLQAGHCCLW